MVSAVTTSSEDLSHWKLEHYNRCNCYKIRFISEGNPASVTDEQWARVHLAVGELGYGFFDEFYDDEHMVVALDRQIEGKHIRDLTDRLHLQIESDEGIELSFCS